jgi:hypothetical protein
MVATKSEKAALVTGATGQRKDLRYNKLPARHYCHDWHLVVHVCMNMSSIA